VIVLRSVQPINQVAGKKLFCGFASLARKEAKSPADRTFALA
jgi:hypothetical protein